MRPILADAPRPAGALARVLHRSAFAPAAELDGNRFLNRPLAGSIPAGCALLQRLTPPLAGSAMLTPSAAGFLFWLGGSARPTNFAAEMFDDKM
jgi:hypothetical protein